MAFLTVEEVAKQLKVTPDAVRAWFHTGKLAALDLGRELGPRIHPKDLEEFIAGHRNSGPSSEFIDMHVNRDVHRAMSDWLKRENDTLARLYKELDQVLIKIGEKIRGNLEMAVKGGDFARSKVYNEAMTVIYKRWSKSRKAYQGWLLEHETRWENREPPKKVTDESRTNNELKLKMKKEELKASFSNNPAIKNISELSPDYFHQLKKEHSHHQNMFNWLRQEHEDIREHFLQLERYIKKIADKLKSQAKKSGKDMDYIKAQVFNDALIILYTEWEKPKQAYNQWLLGQEERWQEFLREFVN